MHGGPTVSEIFPILTNVCALTLVDAHSGYHSLKLDKAKKSSNLTPTTACHFGRYRHAKLPFCAAPTGDMLQYKNDDLFKELPNIFGIAGGILIIGQNTG